MPKIEFVCLGAQDEKEKMSACLVVDGDIYVLGCGIHTPPAETLGIKKIVADFSYLIDNKNRVKGIFIPTPNYYSFGGIEFLLKDLPDVPIFTSNLGQMIINNFIERKMNYRNPKTPKNASILKNYYNVNSCKPLAIFKLGNVQVMAFRTASYMPSSLGFVFKTQAGSIIWVDNFIVPTNVTPATTDLLEHVNRFTERNTILLITSLGPNVRHSGFTSPSYSVTTFFENAVLDIEYRGIFAIKEQDIYKLLKLASICARKTIPFYIYSGSLARAFSFMQQNKIISFPNLIYLNEAQINTVEHGIIVVSGDKQSLFTKLQKIVIGDDNRLTFKPTDTFVYSILTTPGYEKLEANLFDNLNRQNIGKILKLPKDVIPLSQSQEDQKFLINIFKPKYIVPINGLYMDQCIFKEACKSTATPYKNILLISNGQFVSFDGDRLVDTKRFIKVVEQYVGNQGLYDVGASGLFECEQMADSGCVLASLLIDKKEKKITHYNYNIVGVINQLDEKNQPIVDQINKELNEKMCDLLKELNGNSNLSRDQQEYFKKQIIKQYEKKFGKRPLVLLTVLYTDQVDKAIDTIVEENE